MFNLQMFLHAVVMASKWSHSEVILMQVNACQGFKATSCISHELISEPGLWSIKQEPRCMCRGACCPVCMGFEIIRSHNVNLWMLLFEGEQASGTAEHAFSGDHQWKWVHACLNESEAVVSHCIQYFYRSFLLIKATSFVVYLIMKNNKSVYIKMLMCAWDSDLYTTCMVHCIFILVFCTHHTHKGF